MRVLCQKLELGKVDIVLIQEPWIHENITKYLALKEQYVLLHLMVN
jgi:hypothetical protein